MKLENQQMIIKYIISVKDTGICIDGEILSKLFSRFANKSFSETRLGLFIHIYKMLLYEQTSSELYNQGKTIPDIQMGHRYR